MDTSGRVELDNADWSNHKLGKAGPCSVPADLLEEFPQLVEALRTPLSPWGGAGGFDPDSRHLEGLESSGDEFARVTGDWGRATIANLVDTYWLGWPWFAASPFETNRPDLYEELERSRRRGKLTQSSVTYNATMYASMAAQAFLWGGWKPSTPRPCELCSRVFEPIEAHPKFVSIGIGHHLCGYCCAAIVKSAFGHVDQPLFQVLSDVDLTQRLQKVVEVLGFVPPAAFRDQLQMRAIEPYRRRRLEAALVCLPSMELFYERFGKPWTRVLLATGVIEGVRVTARGTMAIAADGHFCRSLGELAIDDFLTNFGIAHDVEPPWPVHPEINPKGRKRGDWLLADGTYVEYAGLTGDQSYDQRMASKVQMARELGIPILVIYPSDLARLHEVFGPHMTGQPTHRV